MTSLGDGQLPVCTETYQLLLYGGQQRQRKRDVITLISTLKKEAVRTAETARRYTQRCSAASHCAVLCTTEHPVSPVEGTSRSSALFLISKPDGG
jgi:hypothetical protein